MFPSVCQANLFILSGSALGVVVLSARDGFRLWLPYKTGAFSCLIFLKSASVAELPQPYVGCFCLIIEDSRRKMAQIHSSLCEYDLCKNQTSASLEEAVSV